MVTLPHQYIFMVGLIAIQFQIHGFIMWSFILWSFIKPPTWVVPHDSCLATKVLPQERWVFLPVLFPDSVQFGCPCQAIQDFDICNIVSFEKYAYIIHNPSLIYYPINTPFFYIKYFLVFLSIVLRT